MVNNIGEQIKKISDEIDKDEVLNSATNEELMGYLFLVEKMKKKLEKLVKLEK